MRCCAQIGINPTGKRPGQAAVQPDPPKRITMAAKKRKPKSLRRMDRPMPVVSTAVASLISMIVTLVTSGTVLLCLFAAKRLL
jgi:hypothetical protein